MIIELAPLRLPLRPAIADALWECYEGHTATSLLRSYVGAGFDFAIGWLARRSLGEAKRIDGALKKML